MISHLYKQGESLVGDVRTCKQVAIDALNWAGSGDGHGREVVGLDKLGCYQGSHGATIKEGKCWGSCGGI